MKFGPDRSVARLFVGAAVGLTVMAAAACSDELPTDYTAAHREAFLAACSRPLDDPRLLSDVCGCVYDRIEDEVRFEEFQRVDQRLAGTSVVPDRVATEAGTVDGDGAEAADLVPGDVLPVEIARLVADCFTREAGL